MLTSLYLPLLGVICFVSFGLVQSTNTGTSLLRRWTAKKEIEVPDEQRLLSSLLGDYHMYSRPVFNASDRVVIKFGLTLVQISDMDEVNQVLTINVWLEQEWEDERLVWDPDDYNGLAILRIPCEKIWLPDIVLYNSADDFTTGYMKSKAMVTANGTVFWPPPAKFRSSCKIDITYFPFDDQVCELKFGSWTYDGFQVDITNRSAKVDLTNYVYSGEWELIDVRVRRTEMYYACCEEPYPDVRFTIIIRRKTLYYLFNIIFPCLWLTILSLLGFWLPPDSGEKITLGITVLLAFSVFMLLIAESMPATSEFVPLIGIYLTVTMAMTSLSIILTVFVLQLHHVGPHQKRVPRWMWTLVLDILAPIVCLCHLSQRYRYLSDRQAKVSRQQRVGLQKHSASGGGREGIVLNTLGERVISSQTGGRGRGRANCNGIVVSGSGTSVAGGGREQGEGGRPVDAEPAISDQRQRPRSDGGISSARSGSGSYVSVAATSIHSAASASQPVNSAGLRGVNDGEPSSRGSVSSPALRDPPWNPGERITCGISRGSPHSPQVEDPSPRGRRTSTREIKHRVYDSARDPGVEKPLLAQERPAPQNSSLLLAQDGAHPKLQNSGQEDVWESKFPTETITLRAHHPRVEKKSQSPGDEFRYCSERKTGQPAVQDMPFLAARAAPGDSAGRAGEGGGDERRERRPKRSMAGRREYQKEQITQHLEVLVTRDDEDDYHQDVVTEWRVVAHVIDRLLFWLFLLVAIISSVIILIIKPLTKPETWRQ